MPTRKSKPTPKRGDIWIVNFDPRIGTEIKKTRPAIVVSNDASNSALERVQVVPITSNIERIYPSEARVTFKKESHKAMADQIMTTSKKRLHKKAGTLTGADILAVEHAIRIQLSL